MRTIYTWMTLAVLALAIMTAGCGRVSYYGEPVATHQYTLIRNILMHPRDYEGGMVTLKGEIVAECPTGCWFNVKDDTGVLYVDLDPSGFAIPQKVHRPVVVEGEVVLQSGKPMLIGTGVEIR